MDHDNRVKGLEGEGGIVASSCDSRTRLSLLHIIRAKYRHCQLTENQFNLIQNVCQKARKISEHKN